MIATHIAKRHAECSSALVLLAGVLFGCGLIAGWVALCGSGIIVTTEEVFARRTSAPSDEVREAAFGRS